jgi:hypothetical protein
MAGAAQADRARRDAGGSHARSQHASGIGQFGGVQASAPSLRIEVAPVNVHDAGELERGISAFASGSNGGLVVTASAAAQRHRDLIINLAARHKLPAVYFERSLVVAGGLISYGVDYVDQFRRAAGYVDRILKGEKPADLPVQAPTTYTTTLNLKTAKALDLDVPATVLVRLDEVIDKERGCESPGVSPIRRVRRDDGTRRPQPEDLHVDTRRVMVERRTVWPAQARRGQQRFGKMRDAHLP